MKQDCSRNVALAMSLCLFLTGCGETQIKRLAEGYEEIDVTYRGWEPAMTQRQLAHTDSKGRKAVIWPWVFSGIFISNNLAIFMGENPEHDHRLIAVSPPELPMDITPQAIGSWAREAGMDVSNIMATAHLMDCKQAANNDLELYAGFGDMNKYTNINILVKWSQIPDMMRQVREKGIERKDRKFGVTYLTTDIGYPKLFMDCQRAVEKQAPQVVNNFAANRAAILDWPLGFIFDIGSLWFPAPAGQAC